MSDTESAEAFDATRDALQGVWERYAGDAGYPGDDRLRGVFEASATVLGVIAAGAIENGVNPAALYGMVHGGLVRGFDLAIDAAVDTNAKDFAKMLSTLRDYLQSVEQHADEMAQSGDPRQ